MRRSRRLRVLITTDAVGGVWFYASMLARELCRRGDQVVLVTLGPEPRSDQLAALDGVQGLSIETTDLALEWTDPEGLDCNRAREWLARIERWVEPDVVHLNSYREALADWRAPVLVVAHSCVRSWWRACRGQDPSETRWQNYVDNVRTGLSAADRWVAPTEAFRDVVAKLYWPKTKGTTIPNGIGDTLAQAPKEPLILAAGRLWDEAKNVSLLARIAPTVPWPIEAVGPRQEPGRDTPSPLHHIRVLGELPRPALLDMMRRASILAAPSVYEPFGLTVLEAAAAGCALVLSDIPTFRELWDGAALFVDARDDAAWRAVLTHLTGNAPLRKDLQHRAKHRAQLYSLTAMADAYAGLYRNLSNGATARERGSHRTSAEVRP
jgi:glycosyltransferase involved in cell wall biosynthesis